MSRWDTNTRILILVSALVKVFAIFGGAKIARPSQIAHGLSSPLPTPTHIHNLIRGLELPSDVRSRQAGIATGSPANGLPWDRTSDYMLGTVSVAIILPQCIGTGCTESWTVGEISQVGSEVAIALEWWQQKAANAGTRVQFQIVPGHPITVPVSNVEPINIPGGNSTALCGNEGAWIDPALAYLGYNNYPAAGNEYLNEVRGYDNDLRQTYDTDWAFVVFVADASNDALHDPVDGDPGRGLFRFTTCGGSTSPFGVSGYGWITGPHMVMNNVNDGWGSNFMDGVAAMEIGHIFGAPDELYAPGACMPPSEGPSCDYLWGYLNVPNGNCRYVGDPYTQTCMLNDNYSIMRYPEGSETGPISNTVNIYTYGHIGWKDTNGNGIADTLDTTPTLSLDPYSPDPSSSRTPAFVGLAEDIPVHTTNPQYIDVSINDVRVEYRIGSSGPWFPALASDGAFDSYHEAYTFTPLFCQNGTYHIEARAVNSVGRISSVVSDTLTISAIYNCRYVYLPAVMKDSGSGAMLPASTPATGSSPFDSPLSLPMP